MDGINLLIGMRTLNEISSINLLMGCSLPGATQLSMTPPITIKRIKLKNIRKNDLIFWKGHVAIATSNRQLTHAYGPLKSTVSMPIKKTIDRIYKTANLKVIGIRRIV